MEIGSPSPDSKASDRRDPKGSELLEPPVKAWDIIRQLGPGLIIAASIVGSGELIATTLTGAKSGLSLLWLILLGCVVKVFAQIEIGRFTVSTGIPPLSAMSLIPGPRIPRRGNWLVWYWFFMWFCSIGQLGGIVGGVGQVLSLVQPLTQQGVDYQRIGAMEAKLKLDRVVAQASSKESAGSMSAVDESPQDALEEAKQQYIARYASAKNGASKTLPRPIDDRLWAIPIALITSVMLIYGSYGLIQSAATAMVAIFTFITMAVVCGMQLKPEWAIPTSDWVAGLSFGLPEGERAKSIAMALATVGIIGVGAAELIQYPYWCLEKGYARFTGPNDGTDGWIARANGWLRVMLADIWVSMVIYTVATLGFFALGAGILHRSGIIPESSNLIQTLSVMYEPFLGAWAPPVYLVGAFVVLYSTFFVANASHARTFTDGLSVMNFIPPDATTQRRSVHILSGLFPMLCLLVYWVLPEPAWLVLLSGSAQAVMLPMLGFAALYFRYAMSVPQLRSGRWFDLGLWGSVMLLFAIGVSNLVFEFLKFTGK
ncbi:MAG: transmembrane Mn(2+) transporter [Planctomycetes bacterium]|nr:transmembrane Mn(2+) transporter [Planctomycetota bacterium]